MAEARAGVITAIEVNSMPTPGNGGKPTFKDGSTWSLIFFLIAVAVLFIF